MTNKRFWFVSFSSYEGNGYNGFHSEIVDVHPFEANLKFPGRPNVKILFYKELSTEEIAIAEKLQLV